MDERKFQGILFDQLDRLLPDHELLFLMQSREWQEEPDLMAIDATGKLYIFEIKAWESQSQNLLQVLRYGQIFGASRYEDLNDIYQKKHSRSLREDHKAKFGIELPEEHFNQSQAFVVLTNGLDVKTREAVRYWRTAGLDVRPWIYRVYRDANQEMLLELNPFRVEDNPYEDVTQGYYILNTNIKSSSQDDQDMVTNGKAAAYFDPWKHKIERLNTGDCVFLYRSGMGIVGVGRASGKLMTQAYHGNPKYPNEEYYMDLTHYKRLTTPFTASEIKRITGVNYSFMQTIFGLDHESGEKILRAVL